MAGKSGALLRQPIHQRKAEEGMGMGSRVVIGMDRHKRSATIEAMAEDETVLGQGRYGTEPAGFEAMLADAAKWPQRVWAVEGCEGLRLVASAS